MISEMLFFISKMKKISLANPNDIAYRPMGGSAISELSSLHKEA